MLWIVSTRNTDLRTTNYSQKAGYDCGLLFYLVFFRIIDKFLGKVNHFYMLGAFVLYYDKPVLN